MPIHVASRRRSAASLAAAYPGARILGHRAGLDGDQLLPYEQARRRIFLPAYRWVLEHRVADLVDELRAADADGEVVLLDYTVNGDVADTTAVLSHAALIRLYVENRWPIEQP